MNIRLNIAANYANLIYSTLIGIIILPLLYRTFGAEAFGLIGFYSILQTWFVLMDLGLSASISRECARYIGGDISGTTLNSLFKIVRNSFLFLSISGAAIIFFFASEIAERWLGLEEIEPSTASYSIKIIGFIIALRWMSSLYRSALNGFEKQLWTSSFGIIVSTLRFPVAYLISIISESSIVDYFAFQLAVAIFELVIFSIQAHRSLPREEAVGKALEKSHLRTLIKFSISVSLVGLLNTSLTQADKLILSKTLPLSEYGDFTLIMVVAGGVIILGGPISSAIIPRLSRLYAQRKNYQLYRLYCDSTLLSATLVFSVGSFFSAMSSQFLFAWTGDMSFAKRMCSILSIYSMANAIYVASSFPHYLQFSHGKMKVQTYYSAGSALILLPALFWSSIKYGAAGASVMWLIYTASGFFVITKFTHRKHLRIKNATWIRNYITPPLVAAIVSSWTLHFLIPWSNDRSLLSLQLSLAGLMIFACSLVSSTRTRLIASRSLRAIKLRNNNKNAS